MIEVERTYRFCSSHRVHRADWNDADNRRVFGTASEEPGHGHNYRITIVMRGPVHRETGCLVDLEALDAMVEREVLAHYDHRNINLDVATMVGRIPTTENVAIDCWNRLLPHASGMLTEVRVRMDEFFTATYRGET